MSRVKGESDLPEQPDRWVCEECDEVCATFLTAPNPFDSDDQVIGCPSCKSVDSLVRACWKCSRPASMGTPAKEFRYINSCYEHRPEA